MDNLLVKEQINLLLETLLEQNEAIKSKEGKIPQIELDILLNNTRNLYESLLQLNKLNNAEIVIAEPTILKEEKNLSSGRHDIETTETKAIETETEKIVSIPEPQNHEAISVPVMAKEKPVMEEMIPIAVEQKIMEERVNVISKNTKINPRSGNLFEEAVLVGDKFQGHTTIHDKISKTKEDKSWNEKLQNQPLQDLKKSIGINEKFKFMNELFDGNLQDYNDSIDTLNKCKSFSEAENFIAQTLAPKYNWKKESGIYQSLIFLIQRKFNF